MSPVTHNAILAIGGAEDKVHGKEILHTFFERSGGGRRSHWYYSLRLAGS